MICTVQINEEDLEERGVVVNFAGGIGFQTVRVLFITVMTLLMMASLTEFRFKYKTLLLIVGLYVLWVAAVCGILLFLGGQILLLRLFILFVSLPAIIIAHWAALDTPAQAVFNYMSQITFSLLIASICRTLTHYFALSDMANLFLMACIYLPLIYCEWNFLRPRFRVLVAVLPNRWAILTLIPCVFCFYLLYVAAWPQHYIDSPVQTAYLYMGMFPLIIVYLAVFKSLYDQYHDQVERQNAALMSVQVAALQQRLQVIQTAEENIRIERHDLRHRLQTLAELVARGDNRSALAFLHSATERLDEQKTVRWCQPPVLDAMFSSYFSQAQHHNIHLEAKISLPNDLPVAEGDLAIVIANALENAIHACLALPPEQRQISIKIVHAPSLMLEIYNKCAAPVVLDAQGLPMTKQKGHGLGVLSISAFCRKYGAVYQFEQKDGGLSLRIIV